MNRHFSQFKSVKAILCLAVLLLVAKPFLAFSIFSRLHPPSKENIFIKAFTKRKQEYAEGSNFNIENIQKKLAEPIEEFFVRFIAFLSILFPSVFEEGIAVTNGVIKHHNISLVRSGTSYQHTRVLII